MAHLSPQNTFKDRLKILLNSKGLDKKQEESFSNHEARCDGVLMWILDAFCLPFHVFLRGRMGTHYFTGPKLVFSSIFFFLTMCMVGFDFRMESYFGLFTPGMIRFFPQISLPESFGSFWGQVAASFGYWCDSIDPRKFKEKFLPSTEGQTGQWSNALTVAAVYYAVANIRFLIAFVRRFSGDYTNPFSAGRTRLLGLLPVWNFLGVYRLGFLFNRKTDVVKQIFEPLLCLFLGMHFMNPDNYDHNWVYLGICLYFGAFLLATHAYVRSLPLRREIVRATYNKFRSHARKSQAELYASVDSSGKGFQKRNFDFKTQ